MADATDTTRVTLTCAKRKDVGEYAHVLRLNEEARWFQPTSETASKIVTNCDLVIEALRASEGDEVRTAELHVTLTGKVNKRTITNCLTRLAEKGIMRQKRRGAWTLIEKESKEAPIEISLLS